MAKKMKSGGYLSCTRKTNPSPDDKSTVLKGGHVDDGATRKETARNQPNPGPRVA